MSPRSLFLGSTTLLLILASCAPAGQQERLEANKQVVQRLLDGMDSGNWAAFDSVFSPDLVVHFPGGSMGRQETETFARMFYTSFPDLTHEIEDLLAVDDKVILRATDRGTHLGDFQGIPATGKSVTLGIIAIYRLADGRIVEAWEQGDFLGLRQQLGVDSIAQ